MGELIRKHSKKLILGVGLLAFVFILAGCSANISLSIDSNPIRFDEDNLEQDVTVTVRTSGIGSVDIDSIDVVIYDNEDEKVYSETIEIDESSFVVPGVEVEEKFDIDICEDFYDGNVDDEDCRVFYDNELKDKKYKLRILVQGSINPTAEADIIFE
ncbi:MAG: hypothetical protein ABR596_07375 [Halarsenatibacteraceae bacterium]